MCESLKMKDFLTNFLTKWQKEVLVSWEMWNQILKKWSFLIKKMISVWIKIDDDKKIAKEIIRDVTWFSSADERFLEVF